jgi:hypothetical protein
LNPVISTYADQLPPYYKIQETIEILDKGITKEHKRVDDLMDQHMEWLGDITRDVQLFVDAPDGTEVVDLDGSGD